MTMPVQGTEGDRSSSTPKLVKYAKKGQLHKLKNALDSGESLNVVDSKMRGALFYAALKGHKKCLKELLKRGANPNQKGQDGQTPCHAAALGGKQPQFSDDTCSTRNPFKGIYYCSKGAYNIVSHYLYHSKHQRRCLEYLVMYGGDLKVPTLMRETIMDIAVRRRQMDIVGMIEEYYELQTTASGYNITKGWSMLRPFTSYPRSCPTWMHTVVSSRASFEDVSPMSSETSPFYNERCKNVYDYGYVHPYDRRNNPGSLSGVPEVLPSEISEINDQESQSTQSIDGSMWSMGSWGRDVSVTLRQITGEGYMNVAYLIGEMDNLSTLRHSNIVLLMAVCCGPTKTDMFLAMEPLQTQSLYDQLHHHHVKFSKERSAEIIWDVTNAVAYLHTVKRVTHNMLSSHAIYFNPNGTTKLCNVFCCHSPDTTIPGKFSSALRLFLAWMAPELMQTRITTFDCDVYSIGVLLWEMLAKEPPWPGLSPPQLGRVLVDEGQRLPLTKNHLDVAPILNSCFGPPVGRLAIAQLLSQVSYLKKTPVSPIRT